MAPDLRHASARDAWSIEAELLFAAARRHPSSMDVDRAHAAMSGGVPIDWVSFVPLAKRHGVLPLLYQHLSTDTFDARLMPSAAFARLREEAERSARRSLMLTGELLSLLDAFEREGIRVVPLKGPILGQQLYGSAALRRTNDLDLLVAEEDAERAVALIAPLGYLVESFWNSDALRAKHRAINHHVQLVSVAKGHRVELHYCITQPLGRQRQTIAALENELERVSFCNRPALVMRPEVLLVYLCIHGSEHLWERIEWAGGIAALLDGGRIVDWDRVEASARRLVGERALESGLHLVRELFDAPMPASELRSDRSARATARSIARRLTTDPARVLDGTSRLIHHVRVDAGIRTRVVRVWSKLFVATASERMAIPLPHALSPLYFLLRPAWHLTRRIPSWASQTRRALARIRHPV